MLGILGGTFDPIHHGHLRLALEIYERLGLQAVHLMVSANPPHRQTPQTPASIRFEMLKLAINDITGLVADNRELKRQQVSYTVETLLEMRQEFGEQLPICLILGMDAFLSLPTWFEWEKIIHLTHLVITSRPEIEQVFSQPLQMLLQKHRAKTIRELKEKPAGCIWFESVPKLHISATQIRQCFLEQRDPHYLLPEMVLRFIYQRGLYNVC
ncbi:MAG: nicotinate-nucleotide adenylyltransferase [Pseudomonadota bacterium]|jgi:nicotinate-nucleotide adenylyltransferase